MEEKKSGKSKGGIARAESLSREQRKLIAKKAAAARWGTKYPSVIHAGNFSEDFGLDIDCYVLDDPQKTAVISKRGMGEAIGLSRRGDRLSVFVNSKTMDDFIGRELREKIENPIIFKRITSSAENKISSETHGYDVTILVDICEAILAAHRAGRLQAVRYRTMIQQAQITLAAAARSGMKQLVYALAGYRPEVEEVIEAFKHYILEEAKKYEKEFPPELYAEWQRLYNITPPQRGKNWKEMHLTVDHIYFPLAKSDGKLLDLLRSAKASKGDRNKKLFQFLNEVGARALRIQIGRVLEMAESSKDKTIYEAKIRERFGGQIQYTLFPTYPIS